MKQLEAGLRVVQRGPVHVDGHAHTFPALQVPPFEQTGEQTANKTQELRTSALNSF